MSANRTIIVVFIIAALGTAFFIFRPSTQAAPVRFAPRPTEPVRLLPLSANILVTLEPLNPFGLVPPVAQFKDRITLKTFGMYITPDTSPVEHDRFAGFHTGVDAEFTDTPVDIPVVAIADGTVVASKRANGYGGVIVVRHMLAGTPLFVLYGHLDPHSLLGSGSAVSKGQQLGILGDDHSEETDNVRKHLHLAFYTGAKIDFRGYVPTEADLSQWLDPMDYF